MRILPIKVPIDNNTEMRKDAADVSSFLDLVREEKQVPYARVMLSGKAHYDTFIEQLEARLPQILAEELSVGSPRPLTAGDITLDGEAMLKNGIQIATHRPRVLESDVMVLVFANNYPGRVELRDQIAANVVARLKEFMPRGLKAWAWVLLCEGGFASIQS